MTERILTLAHYQANLGRAITIRHANGADMSRKRKQAAENRMVLDVPEAAEILNISRAAAYAAARSGDIPTVRIGGRILVPRAALMRLLDGQSGAPSNNR
jgi:excisionase family DNA binding protein